jgi:NAD(P)-dependent dehydrogenase (short-subunit alcohol dehydrogenase family)
MFELTHKIALITGAGSGIGKAIALLFSRQGATIHLLDMHQPSLDETLAAIQSAGGKAVAHRVDVTHVQEVDAAMKEIGRADILVNCAGVAHVGTATNTAPADFERIYSVNVKGVYHALHFGIPLLLQKGGGAILNIASIAGITGIPDRFAYSMSKGAVIAMTRSVAQDYLHQNIRCNSISPARIHTPFVDGFIAKNYPGNEEVMLQKLAASQPIGRMGTVEEVAQLALYLCSDAATFLSGNDYPIDGGYLHLNH